MTKRFWWSRMSQFVIWCHEILIQFFWWLIFFENLWKTQIKKNDNVSSTPPVVYESIVLAFLTPHAFWEPPIWSFDLFLKLQLFVILVNIFCMTHEIFVSIFIILLLAYRTKFKLHLCRFKCGARLTTLNISCVQQWWMLYESPQR